MRKLFSWQPEVSAPIAACAAADKPSSGKYETESDRQGKQAYDQISPIAVTHHQQRAETARPGDQYACRKQAPSQQLRHAHRLPFFP
jgi:hypothetical protein